MDSNLVIFSLEHTYLVNSYRGIFESNTGLWQDHLEWSRTLIPYNTLNEHPQEETRVMDNVSRLRLTVMILNHNGMCDINHIKLVEPQLNNQLITISINGNETFVNNSRSEILKSFMKVNYEKIALTPGELKAVNSNFLQRLNSIALRFEVEITMADYESNFNGLYAKSDVTCIYIFGDANNLSLAKTNVRILIDTLLDGYFVDRIRVPLLMIPCLGGAGLTNFTELTHDLKVRLYLPNLNHSISNIGVLQKNDEVSIWLTSDRVAELSVATDAISNLLSIVDPTQNEQSKIFTQEIEISKEKLDLIGLYHQTDMFNIMHKYGTCIRKEFLAQTRVQRVFVQGQTPTSVQNAALDLSSLSCNLYYLEITFSQGPASTDLEYYLINLINLKRTCVLTYNEYGLTVLGAKEEIHALLNELGSDLKNHHFFFKMVNGNNVGLYVALSMEIANDQQDFLSGKKNGKVIKILNQVGNSPSIEFRRLNNFNFIVRLSISVGSGAKNKQIFTTFDVIMRTINLIEMEYPAQLEFNIPEVFHKSIIGNGGSIIQSIMKKYNVFIKFSRNGSGSDVQNEKTRMDSEQVLFLFRRHDNVLIKCPMKNLKNIMFVKYEIDQLVQQCCQNSSLSFNGISVIYNTVKFKLLKSHYLLLTRKLNYNLRFVSDLEDEFSTFIDFPKSIDAFEGYNSVIITIKGNDNRARLCAEKMAGFLPRSFEIKIPCGLESFANTISSKNESFRENVIIPFKLLLRTELIIEPSSQPDLTHKIILSSYERQLLATAVSELTVYLRTVDLMIIEKQELLLNPIVSIEEIASPSKQSLYRLNLRSPQKSPQRNPGRCGSPKKKGKNPLDVITNHNMGPLLKSFPQLSHAQQNETISMNLV